MPMNNIKLPKITNDLAKFNRIKKQYIAYPEVLEKHNDTKQREILLLTELQTKWEQLRLEYPDDNNKLKSIKKYCLKVFAFNKQIFLPITTHGTVLIDERWLDWSQLLHQFYNELYRHIQPLTPQGFSEFQTYVHDTIAQTCKTEKRLKQAYRTVRRFISYQNKHFMLNDYHYPNISISLPSKFNPLTIDTNWVTYGKQINKIICATHEYWHQKKDYSHDEILGWLLFSGIIYGGINEKQLLKGWFTALLNTEHQPFINQRILISSCFEQTNYGNARDDKSNKLYNTQQVIIDLVSQCWLLRYQQQYSPSATKHILNHLSQDKIERYLMSVLSSVNDPLDLHIPTFSQLLSYASYHWEMLDGANIDQASVSVLRGKQNTAGLTNSSLGHFLNPICKNPPTTYDLDEVLKLSIKPIDKSNTLTKENERSKISVRRSDLIADITKIFQFEITRKNKKRDSTALTLLEKITKRRNQCHLTYETVFLDWISTLIPENKPKNTSILQYIKSIGYEWLYFTMDEPIDRWDEEDFEMLYEDILEYKTIIRRNIEISYYAKLLQRLHNFAHENHDFPAVTISYEKSGRRVRAELIPPPIYYSVITQILNSVDILEREMFALMFILVYRTGMRKKELLGLRYIDIEGLHESTPLVVVRSNRYRTLKTGSSNRRIPIFALLKPNELAFFIRYVQSNIGTNPNKFIFTLSSEQIPVDDHVPLQLLRRILQDVLGSKNTLNYTFHAFRHTAVSNLSLVLQGHIDLVEALSDYDKHDVERIKYGLVGEHITAQDSWYALSGMIGHLSPHRSFEYYNHVAVLMATYALSVADIKLPSHVINNITGFDNKRLKENHATIEHGCINLPSIRALLTRNIFNGKQQSPQFFMDITSPLIEQPTLSDELFMRYGLNRILLLLQQIDKGIKIKQAAITANIGILDATILINRANLIATIPTTHGMNRFIKGDGIVPLSIQYRSDFRLLSSLQKSAQQLRKISMDDWQWFINICQQRLSSSKAFVPFSNKEEQALQRFIGIAKQLLPSKSWLIATHTLNQPTAYMLDIQNMRHVNKAEINTINVGIATPDDRKSERNKTKWQYSPLLRFFVHMMLITDETLPIVDKEI